MCLIFWDRFCLRIYCLTAKLNFNQLHLVLLDPPPAIDRIQPGATTPGQSGPRSNDKEEVLHIQQSSKTEVSLSEGFVSYSGHTFGMSYLSSEMQAVYSTAPASIQGLYCWLKNLNAVI